MSTNIDHASSHGAAHDDNQALRYIRLFWNALDGTDTDVAPITLRGRGSLPSIYPVTDFATAAIGVAGLAISELVGQHASKRPGVTIDRHLASHWFNFSIRPDGWTIPPAWDAIAGDYRAADGWIKLHTNAPHHRAVAESVLAQPAARTLWYRPSRAGK